MKNTAVLYGSTTGNTEAVAKRIATELDAAIFDVALQPVSEIPKLNVLKHGLNNLKLNSAKNKIQFKLKTNKTA